MLVLVRNGTLRLLGHVQISRSRDVYLRLANSIYFDSTSATGSSVYLFVGCEVLPGTCTTWVPVDLWGV